MYRCLLETQPDHLTPAWLIGQRYRADAPTDLLFSEGIRQRLPTLWVPDTATHVQNPFMLKPSTWLALQAWRRGGILPSQQLITLLRAAGIVTTVADRSANLAEWDDAVATCRISLQSDYAPVRGLIHPFQLSALRRYFRLLIRRKHLRFGDPQCPLRYVAYNEPIASYFHWQLTSVVSKLFGKPVKPSYCYFICYQAGAALEKHVDRDQCEYTLAVCLDFSPEPIRSTPWPLQLQLPTGTVVVYQALGDALVYRGCRIPHFRTRLAEGCTSSSILFHYVDKNFAGTLN
jgi:hypothetical protein